ncbi:MAG TPA: 50S ribosomal protein L1 [Candidatus Polarisedimenticolia bacterium]|nr:50S ribosomal protein L1 [Candidatus Polarisedimenticolia bacterium]
MKRHGKKYLAAKKQVPEKPCTLEEAIPILKKIGISKFEETMEIALLLGVDPKHADQMVRGTVVLPHGTGASKKVLVIATGDKQKEAQAAGADHVGGPELVPKIQEGWLDFDAIVATPDTMREVGKLGKVLGPKGLMPNPKTGTVTLDVAKAVQEIKAGKVEFRVDKTSIIHVPFGRSTFPEKNLLDNARALIGAVLRAKPPTAKGKYVRTAYLSSTMSPSIRLDVASLESLA